MPAPGFVLALVAGASPAASALFGGPAPTTPPGALIDLKLADPAHDFCPSCIAHLLAKKSVDTAALETLATATRQVPHHSSLPQGARRSGLPD